MAKEKKDVKDAPKNEEKIPMPALQITAQYVKDLSFEAPHMPLTLLEMQTQPPKIDISIDVKAQKADKEKPVYTVDLIIKANAHINGKSAFICELTYGALVSLNLPQEHHQPVLLIEVPHLMFPFARSIIANATREAGFAPLALAPIDFSALYRQRMEQHARSKKEEN